MSFIESYTPLSSQPHYTCIIALLRVIIISVTSSPSLPRLCTIFTFRIPVYYFIRRCNYKYKIISRITVVASFPDLPSHYRLAFSSVGRVFVLDNTVYVVGGRLNNHQNLNYSTIRSLRSNNNRLAICNPAAYIIIFRFVVH